MFRVVGLAVLLSGCDVVLGLEREIPASVCGNYGDLQPLAFNGLDEVTDFSVEATGLRGFVQATHASRTGLTPIKLQDGTWIHDPAFEANLGPLQAQELVHFGRISYTGDLFASQRSQSTGLYSVYHYAFRTDAWVLANNFAVAMATGQSTYAGSTLETTQGPGVFAQVPIIHVPDTGAPFVGIAERPPSMMTWTEAVSGGRLSTFAINEAHDVTHAVVGRGPNGKNVLLYAARPKGALTGSDLYLSEKDGAFYPAGTPLEAVNTDEEELEPWISEDCRTLYFRRGDTVMSAVVR